MAAQMDISNLFFFMPVFSFLFVFVVVYAILAKTKVLGDGRVNIIVSFIMAIIFMNFSSLNLFVNTITPWFVVLLICLFFVLVLVGFSSTDLLKKMVTPTFGWVVVIILIAIFLIAAIRVFNPVFHPSLILTSGGEGSPGVVWQIRNILDSQVVGSILLLVVGIAAAWFLTKK